MRGQMGFVLLIAGALLVGGCKHQTPEQKAQSNLEKQQAADAKAQAKRDAEQAAQDKKAADAQAKADAQAAKERAEQEKKQAAIDAEYKKKYPYGPYPDDKLKVIGYPYILPENRTHYLDEMVEAMSASGAAYEAMLYEHDFSGTALNSAGRSRLGLMLKDMPSDQPATIFVSVAAAEDRTNALIATVDKAVKEIKPDSQIAVKAGANASVSAPAASGLNALKRLEKQSQTSSGMSSNQSSANTPVSP